MMAIDSLHLHHTPLSKCQNFLYARTQHRRRINIWEGIFGHWIIEPFLEQNLGKNWETFF